MWWAKYAPLIGIELNNVSENLGATKIVQVGSPLWIHPWTLVYGSRNSTLKWFQGVASPIPSTAF